MLGPVRQLMKLSFVCFLSLFNLSPEHTDVSWRLDVIPSIPHCHGLPRQNWTSPQLILDPPLDCDLPSLIQESCSSTGLWVVRKPAVCFVLRVLYPELLKCVLRFLIHFLYDYELNQHIIKSAHLANLPLNRVVFREGNRNSMQRKRKEPRSRKRTDWRVNRGKDWTKLAIRRCPRKEQRDCVLPTLPHGTSLSMETPHKENGKTVDGTMWVFICLKENVQAI